MVIYSARVDGEHICFVEAPDKTTQEERNQIRRDLGFKYKVPTHYWRLYRIPDHLLSKFKGRHDTESLLGFFKEVKDNDNRITNERR